MESVEPVEEDVSVDVLESAVKHVKVISPYTSASTRALCKPMFPAVTNAVGIMNEILGTMLEPSAVFKADIPN